MTLTRETLQTLTARQQPEQGKYAPVGAPAPSPSSDSSERKTWLIALGTAAVVGFWLTAGAVTGLIVRNEL